MRTCSRKGIIIYAKYAMFIKSGAFYKSQRMTLKHNINSCFISAEISHPKLPFNYILQ